MEGEQSSTSKDTTARKDNTHYKANMGEAISKEEMEKLTGEYEDDGFYVLEAGGYYDLNGYYFDKDGYDAYGGYYENGYYVPGPEHAEEYYRRYEEAYGVEQEDEFEYDLEDYFSEEDEYSDEEGTEGEAVQQKMEKLDVAHEPELTEDQKYEQELKERIIEEDANRLIPIAQFINPAIEWLGPQQADKKFVVRIVGLPHQANASHVERLLLKKLKDAGVKDIPDPLSSVLKVVIDKDKQGYSTGVGYCTSAYRPVLIQLIKLYKKVWIKNVLKTYISGFTYDEDIDGGDYGDEYHDHKVDKWVLKNPDYELMVYRKRARLQKKDPVATTNPVPTTSGAGEATTAPATTTKPKKKAIISDYGEETVPEKKPAAEKKPEKDDEEYG